MVGGILWGSGDGRRGGGDGRRFLGEVGAR